MLEVAILSIWASVRGWLTPTVLFVLLNLVIGTIAVTSKGARRRDADGSGGGGGGPRHLLRAPSLVLDRLRSFNLNRYLSGDIPLETAPQFHAFPDPAAAAAAAEPEAAEAIHAPEVHPASAENNQFSRSQSDAHPTAGEVPVKLAAKMKKSASDGSAFAHFEAEEAEVVRRPATMRTRTGRLEAEDEDEEGEEVDARAADFINRFRQQLKLQRLDSIMRYKEMLNRGAGNQI